MSTAELKVPPVRNVVIGHDRNKKARAIRDDVAANIQCPSKRGFNDDLVFGKGAGAATG